MGDKRRWTGCAEGRRDASEWVSELAPAEAHWPRRATGRRASGRALAEARGWAGDSYVKERRTRESYFCPARLRPAQQLRHGETYTRIVFRPASLKLDSAPPNSYVMEKRIRESYF